MCWIWLFIMGRFCQTRCFFFFSNWNFVLDFVVFNGKILFDALSLIVFWISNLAWLIVWMRAIKFSYTTLFHCYLVLILWKFRTNFIFILVFLWIIWSFLTLFYNNKRKYINVCFDDAVLIDAMVVAKVMLSLELN